MNRVQLIRITLGLFLAYTFICFLNAAVLLQVIRDFYKSNLWNVFFKILGTNYLALVTQILSVIGILMALLFIFKKYIRVASFFLIVLIVSIYNLDICINQPHLSYLIFSLVLFSFSENSADFINESYARILQIVYGLQMTISGFSKLTMPEWRDGKVFSLMSRIYDPEPGIYFINMLPEPLLLILAWFVLAIECASFIYLFKTKARFGVLILHISMYIGIIFLVPHAKHVAFTMILFNFLIIDKPMLPKIFLSTDKM